MFSTRCFLKKLQDLCEGLSDFDYTIVFNWHFILSSNLPLLQTFSPPSDNLKSIVFRDVGFYPKTTFLPRWFLRRLQCFFQYFVW